jgi:hypothetical protein
LKRKFKPNEYIEVTSFPTTNAKINMLYRIEDKFYLCEYKDSEIVFTPIGGGAEYPKEGTPGDILSLVDADENLVNWKHPQFTDAEAEEILAVLSGKPFTPNNILPVNESLDIYQIPTFVGSKYESPVNSPMQKMEIRISDNSNMNNILFSRQYEQETMELDPNEFYDIIEANTIYYWQIRYQDILNRWSTWSNKTSFKTKEVFEPTIIKQPFIIYPLNEVKVAPIEPFILSSTMQIIGSADNHESTDWEVSSGSDFNTLLYQSLDDTTNKTSIQLPITITGNTYVKNRYKGQSTPEKSPWSSIRMFRPREYYTNPLIGVGFRRGANGFLSGHWIDVDGNDVNVSASYWNNNPMYLFNDMNILVEETNYCEFVTVIPTLVKCYTNYEAGVGEDVHRYWIAPEGNAPDDFYLHPAFKSSDGPIFWGKYATSYFEGTDSSTISITTPLNSSYYKYQDNTYPRKYANVTDAVASANIMNKNGYKGFHVETVYDVALRALYAIVQNKTFGIGPMYKPSEAYSSISSFLVINEKGKYANIYDAFHMSAFTKRWMMGFKSIPNGSNINLGYPDNLETFYDTSIKIININNSSYSRSYTKTLYNGFDNNLGFDRELLFYPNTFEYTAQIYNNDLTYDSVYNSSQCTPHVSAKQTNVENTHFMPLAGTPASSPSIARLCKWTIS